MRSCFFAFLGALLIAPAIASAALPPGPQGSPTVYVCTADAQVLKIDGTTGASTVYANGAGTFDDCVVGPDGQLYIANGSKIVRLDLSGTALSSTPVTVATLPSNAGAARGLAFNLSTLYINTASAGLYKLDGATLSPLLTVTPSGGHGLTFDVLGNMVIASGGKLLRSLTPQYVSAYNKSSAVELVPHPTDPLGTPFGLALNTCREVLFADPSSKRLKRLVTTGTKATSDGIVDVFDVKTIVSFTGKNVPLNLEIDSSNRAYLLLADDESGGNARVVLVEPTGAPSDTTGAAWITTCSNLTVTRTLVDLKAALNDKIGLTSAQAVGIAVEPTAHALSYTFLKGANCSASHEFDFGYHSTTMYFATCPDTDPDHDSNTGLTITVTAHKSKPADVVFAPSPFTSDLFPNIHGMQYSSLGGYALQYVLKSSASLTALGVVPQRIKYAFFTQDAIGQPGLARSPIDDVGATGGVYNEDVTSDFWDIGLLDAAGGERENDFSKRVVYNSGVKSAQCEFAGTNSEPLFDEPLNTGNPLFNGPQNIKVSIGVSGAGCSNGTVRVSVMRINRVGGIEVSANPQTVRSNSQSDNLMDSLNGKYTFNLDATVLDTTGATKKSPAEFKITLSGNVDQPVSKTFFVQKQ